MPSRNGKRTRQRVLLSAEDVIEILHAEIEKAGSQTAWARRTGANRTSLNLALTGRQPVTQSLLDALGLERVVAFTPRRRRGAPRAAAILSSLSHQSRPS
jgi:hypothetical protein